MFDLTQDKNAKIRIALSCDKTKPTLRTKRILTMSRGGLRPRTADGSLEHLLKPKWKSGQTRTIRVPVVLADQLLEIAHKLDNADNIDLTQDNKQKAISLLKQAITPKSKGGNYAANNATGLKKLVEEALALMDLTQDN